MVGDRVGVVKTEHLEAYGGTASQGDQAAQHFGLQQVMVGVVVSLAEEKEIGANQTGYEILAIDKSGGGRRESVRSDDHGNAKRPEQATRS